jgi:hypothetical protein
MKILAAGLAAAGLVGVVGCATTGANRPPEVAQADVFYTPIGICSKFHPTTPAHEETGPNLIYVVARIDSIRTPTPFTFDPARLYIGSPGQTLHGESFDLTISTAQSTPIPAGGVPYSLGDMAVAYQTADRTDVYIDHTFKLQYDGRGVLVHQSTTDIRQIERPHCDDSSVFTG